MRRDDPVWELARYVALVFVSLFVFVLGIYTLAYLVPGGSSPSEDARVSA